MRASIGCWLASVPEVLLFMNEALLFGHLHARVSLVVFKGLATEEGGRVVVVFGGVYIYGGAGSIFGVFLSIIILGMVTFGLSLLNIPGVGIIIITGLLLILTVALSSFIKKFSENNI